MSTYVQRPCLHRNNPVQESSNCNRTWLYVSGTGDRLLAMAHHQNTDEIPKAQPTSIVKEVTRRYASLWRIRPASTGMVEVVVSRLATRNSWMML